MNTNTYMDGYLLSGDNGNKVYEPFCKYPNETGVKSPPVPVLYVPVNF